MFTRRKTGYSMVETILVVAIIVILGGTVTYGISSTIHRQKEALYDVGNKTKADLLDADSENIMESMLVWGTMEQSEEAQQETESLPPGDFTYNESDVGPFREINVTNEGGTVTYDLSTVLDGAATMVVIYCPPGVQVSVNNNEGESLGNGFYSFDGAYSAEDEIRIDYQSAERSSAEQIRIVGMN